jgi:hypothetical protein
LIIDLDFSAAVFRISTLSPFTVKSIFSVFIDLPVPKATLSLLWFFLGGMGMMIRLLYLLLFNRLHQHPISSGFTLTLP